MRLNCLRRLLLAGLVFATLDHAANAQPRVDGNVVYGMYSGTALLLDVHHPVRPNGFGIVFIPGSGWAAPLGYSAPPLKESAQVATYVPSLLQAGYTVFAITHRATPTFRYPAALEDAQRAVRFIRHNAAKYGIDSARIGGYGGSSGGHLIGLLATMDGTGDPSDPDPVNRESAKVQCIVARAAPVDLLRMAPTLAEGPLALLLGANVGESTSKTSIEYKTAFAASPINYVSTDDPPALLVHGDADRTVPFHQSEMMEIALKRVGVPVRLVRVEGGDHDARLWGSKIPEFKAEMVKWFDQYLRRMAPSQ